MIMWRCSVLGPHFFMQCYLFRLFRFFVCVTTSVQTGSDLATECHRHYEDGHIKLFSILRREKETTNESKDYCWFTYDLELYNELFQQHSDVFIHLLHILVFPKWICIHNEAVFIYWSFLFVGLVSWLADLTVLFAFLAVELQLDLCTLHFLFFILLSWVIFPFIRTWYGILFSIHRVYCYFLMNLFKSCGFFFYLDACKLSSSVTFFLLHF